MSGKDQLWPVQARVDLDGASCVRPGAHPGDGGPVAPTDGFGGKLVSAERRVHRPCLC